MRIAVTGATGFVGGHVLARLVPAGHDVVALCREPRNAPVPALPLDLASPSSVVDLKGFDAVLHLAAFLPPSYTDATYAETCMSTNAFGTLRLATAAADAGVPAFIYMSSGNAYAPKDTPVRETDALFPAARAPYYLMSKVAAEVFATHVGLQKGMRTVILRPSAIYGAGMKGGLIPTLSKRALAKEALKLQDGGRYAVDLVHVRDVAQACQSALERSVSGPYNVGSGELSTVLSIATALIDLVGGTRDMIELGPAGPSGPDRGFSALDIARARADLDYAPTPMVEGLRDYVSWLKA